MTARRLAALALVLAASGCATAPPPLPDAPECRANFIGLDQRVAAAHARNGGAHAIPGFPYLRSDRFLASFRHEAADGPAFEAWVERLRRLDLDARESELRNLGWDDPAGELRHLDACGREWAAHDLADPGRRALLRENAAVPDDYSMLQRTLGLYPVAAFFLNVGIDSFNDEVREDYATPLEQLHAGGPRVLWQPGEAPGGEPLATDPPRDALGVPVVTDAQWGDLAAAHAPHWLVETSGDYDAPGAPGLARGLPSLDRRRPVTYFLPAFTRFGDEILLQLVYVVWFSERPRIDFLDPYAGRLDGVVWRVTLGRDGAPLLYDTVHACGCYHYYFVPERPAGRAPLRRREQGGFWDEPVLFPQPAPPEPFAVRLESRTHYVRRLVPLADAAAERVALYARADYGELLSLADTAGGRRSLFREDGLVRGTERAERFFLWPAGVRSPGAMRQWGRHATSFVGRSHFDDARMLERVFVPD